MITSIDTALVVDDDVLMREFVVETLNRNGIMTTQVGSGLEAKRIMAERCFDIAFVDLKMPGMSGMELLRHMREEGQDTLAVIVTAFGTVEQAVEAMKIGAYDFLMKPFSPEQVELIIKRANELVGLKAQNAYLQEELGWSLPRGRQMLGCSKQMRILMDRIQQVAGSSSNVLITGESGTGKELVSLAIHSLGENSSRPFVRMNCAAVPDTLMDSELFGHEKGSFTSAASRRLGRFELAAGGSLLLDEISEMKLGLQGKLLRVLQEKEFERVGGNKTISADCRVIATTNRSLSALVAAGEFRQDLFYRLNVVPVNVPPLRERAEDIPVLINMFLKKIKPGEGKDAEPEVFFNDDAMKMLCSYSWPGNVRELENLVERLCVVAEGPEFGPALIENELKDMSVGFKMQEITRPVIFSAPGREVGNDLSIINLAELEKDAILKALNSTGGNRQQTADALGISVRTLRNKLNQYRQEGLSLMASVA